MADFDLSTLPSTSEEMQAYYEKLSKELTKAVEENGINEVIPMIAVAIASRKIKGGIGLHLGLGILIAFTYILFMQISTTFATNGNLSPLIAVWIPNIVFMFIAVLLVKTAPK